MVYDFKQLHAIAAELDEPHAESAPVVGQPDVVDLRLAPDARLYDVAYKPTDDQRSPGPAAKTPPPPRPNKKTSPGPAAKTPPRRCQNEKPSPKTRRRRPPPTCEQVEEFRKQNPPGLPTSGKPSPEFVDAEVRLHKSKAKLERLTHEIAILHSRVQRLDPALKQRLIASGFQVEWDHLTEELTELNAKVAQRPDRFEFIIDKRYDPLMERIIAADRMVDAIENPQTWMTDKFPKPLVWIRQIEKAIKSIKLP